MRRSNLLPRVWGRPVLGRSNYIKLPTSFALLLAMHDSTPNTPKLVLQSISHNDALLVGVEGS